MDSECGVGVGRVAVVGGASPTRSFRKRLSSIHLLNSIQTIGTISKASCSAAAELLFRISMSWGGGISNCLHRVCLGVVFFHIASAKGRMPGGTLVEIDWAAMLYAAGNLFRSIFGSVASVP